MNGIEKVYYGDVHIREMISDIAMKMHRDNWKPDYIVGLTRGGLIPAVYLSHYLDGPMETLKVSLRDSTSESESNLWMAEDAFNDKNILIVDDINDTGATLDWIINDWQSSCLPDDPHWLHVWVDNVRIAVLVDNLSSNFSRRVDYCAKRD